MDDTQIKSLLCSTVYEHDTDKFEVIQTHLSWVILTGAFAYKIKKPISLGFNDYTTLELRKHYTELELKLNQSLAPELYIEVRPIYEHQGHLSFKPGGEVVEYALKMNQFDQSQLLSHLHQTEGLSKAIVKSIALQIAAFHDKLEPVDEASSFGQPETVMAPVLDNFETMLGMELCQPVHTKVREIQAHIERSFEALKPVLSSRKAQGFTRPCHGDMHLGNIVLKEGKPVVFDCIEFNEDFRMIDTINDVGFLIMDLEHKGYQQLAHVLTNYYFESAQDYQGLLTLDFFKSYRAMVRAKVSAFQLMDDRTEDEKKALLEDMEAFVDLAHTYTKTRSKPSLTITCGPSGSGKTVYSEKQMATHGAIRLRSDVIRKQMFDLDPFEPTPDDLKASMYSDEITQKVYAKMEAIAQTLLQAQYSVIIDATCLKYWQREVFAKLGAQLDCQFKIVAFDFDQKTLETRVNERRQECQVSDAGVEVLLEQLRTQEPLRDNEKPFAELIAD